MSSAAPYRDDLDATRARAEALEAELDALHDEGSPWSIHDELGTLEAERAAVAASARTNLRLVRWGALGLGVVAAGLFVAIAWAWLALGEHAAERFPWIAVVFPVLAALAAVFMALFSAQIRDGAAREVARLDDRVRTARARAGARSRASAPPAPGP